MRDTAPDVDAASAAQASNLGEWLVELVPANPIQAAASGRMLPLIVFALLLGYSRVPYAAARDGYFFKVFSRLHPSQGFPYVSLVVLAVLESHRKRREPRPFRL